MALAGSPDKAYRKPAGQSSDAFGAPASRVVDGDTNGVFLNNSVNHTNQELNAWWQTDLGASTTISTLNVWNRTDCCSERLDDFWVFVSDTPFDMSLTPDRQAAKPGVWSSHQAGSAPVVTTVHPGVPGRYVMIQLNGTNYLSLAEVEVY
jgi:hypothetical protein